MISASRLPTGKNRQRFVGALYLIQRNANHAFDVTDEVYPETAELATLVAHVIGLDIAVGKLRPVGKAIFDNLFAANESGCVPLGIM